MHNAAQAEQCRSRLHVFGSHLMNTSRKRSRSPVADDDHEQKRFKAQDKRRRRKKKRKLAVTAAIPTRVAQQVRRLVLSQPISYLQASPSKSSTPEPINTTSIAEELQAKTLVSS